MKYLTTAGTLVALCCSTSVYAAETSTGKIVDKPGYVSLSGDFSWLSDSDVQNGAYPKVEYSRRGGGNIAIGYNPLKKIVPFAGARTELEGGYHFNSVKHSDGTLRFGTLMANAYFDMPNDTQFTPYVGVGLGIAQVHFSRSAGLGNVKDGRDNAFAYQAMAGVAYTLPQMPEADVYLGYRYIGVHKPRFDYVKFDSLNNHSVEVGFRYHF